MNLQEKRAELELNQIPILVISQVVDDDSPIIYVVMKTEDFNTRKTQSGRFRLHRYWIGNNCGWEGVKEETGSLEDCLSLLHERLTPYNKKVEQMNWDEFNENPLMISKIGRSFPFKG